MNENARIIIFERDSYVSFANCGLPYYLGGEIQAMMPVRKEDRSKRENSGWSSSAINMVGTPCSAVHFSA